MTDEQQGVLDFLSHWMLQGGGVVEQQPSHGERKKMLLGIGEDKFIGVSTVCGDYEERAVYVHFNKLWARPDAPPREKETAYRPIGCDSWISAMMDAVNRLFATGRRPSYLILHLDNTVRAPGSVQHVI